MDNRSNYVDLLKFRNLNTDRPFKLISVKSRSTRTNRQMEQMYKSHLGRPEIQKDNIKPCVDSNLVNC